MSRENRLRKPAVRRGRALVKALKRGALVCLLVALVSGMSWGAYWLYAWLDAPIEVISVEGKFEQISQRELQQLVEPLVRGGIVSLDLLALRDQLQRHPWISAARVSRQWPNGVRIYVEEEVAIARWNDKGFLNSRGQLMEIADNSSLVKLPLLSGPAGEELEVMTRYREVAELLLPYDLAIASMTMDQRGVLEVRLRDGLEIKLGKGNAMEKVRRLLVVWKNNLAAQRQRIKALDLRYTNGVAVSWQEALAQR